MHQLWKPESSTQEADMQPSRRNCQQSKKEEEEAAARSAVTPDLQRAVKLTDELVADQESLSPATWSPVYVVYDL